MDDEWTRGDEGLHTVTHTVTWVAGEWTKVKGGYTPSYMDRIWLHLVTRGNCGEPELCDDVHPHARARTHTAAVSCLLPQTWFNSWAARHTLTYNTRTFIHTPTLLELPTPVLVSLKLHIPVLVSLKLHIPVLVSLKLLNPIDLWIYC